MVAIIAMYVIMITLTHLSNKSKEIKAKSLDKMLAV